MPEDAGPSIAFYAGPLLTCFIATAATAMLAAATATDTVAEGIALGVVEGVGIAAAIAFVGGIFDPHKPQPMVWFAIFAGYQLAGLVLAAVIVAVWD